MNRRALLTLAPAAVLAAPAIAKAIPSPMPIVDTGPFSYANGWDTNSPRTITRIWANASKLRDSIKGQVLASEYKVMMEDAIEKATGHRPPFVLRNFERGENEFIFHRPSNRAEGNIASYYHAKDQPCYLIEWMPDFWRRIFSHRAGENIGYADTGLLEYMTCFNFREPNRVIYDL